MPPPTFARRAARLLPFFSTLAASIAGLAESHAAGPDFSLGLHLVHHRVEERGANGAHLLTETGWTPMLVARLTQPLPLGRLDAHLSWNDGSLDYDGRSQTGSRFQTTTDQRIWRAGFGYALPIAPTLDLRARWELEDRRRHIQGRGAVAGLDERYRQHYAALGLIWAPAAAPAGTTFSAEWIAGLGGRQTTRADGYIDPVTAPGNGVHGASLGARIPLGAQAGNPAHRPRFALLPQLEYLHADRGETRAYRSNGVIAGSIVQPETTRWQIGAGLEVVW